MNIKKYFTKDMKCLIALLTVSGIVFAITANMMANNTLNCFGACLFVTAFIMIPVLIGAIISYIFELRKVDSDDIENNY